MSAPRRDHGGGIDAARQRHGGRRSDWLDLSTGINPCPYPVPSLPAEAWTALPDRAATEALAAAARQVWQVPETAAILAAPGASALIARLPLLAVPGRVAIPDPTYNEHAAAFAAGGWQVAQSGPADAAVVVHPNNPDGRIWTAATLPEAAFTIIDESFCDVMPEASLIDRAARPDTVILKSFGKFWGLAGLRLGFAIGAPALIDRLAEMLGPWPVSGPALRIGAAALADAAWATATRARLDADAARLDALLTNRGLRGIGGTSLFRLCAAPDATEIHRRLARARILTRAFPYAPDWLRLGLPGRAPDWARLDAAL
jgi:cobalamin biosynthetic protein CobC